ncbi:hypothetical protein Ahy_B06g083779 [Arachis hypogaea]|uniref:Uncharacterized protein n=1 Tax=Arachis hypogaea TaxID=3818 RepID=A0A444YQE6_ARAHY|nr:hypothetical protein Ahy_B06g083779 [Arachis hypogaea]
MSGYSSAMKLEIEKFDGRINFGLWQIQVKNVLIQSGLHKALKEKISEDKKYPHGITALPWIRISCGNRVHNCTWALVGVEMQGRWLKNFQEKPIWKLHHEFSARFRSVPRRNAWSGLIPSEYTFMVEYDSSLNYDCRPTLLRIANGVGGLGYKYEAKFSICFCTSQKHFKLVSDFSFPLYSLIRECCEIFALRECECTGVPVLERKKSMCCNNFHIVIFSGCHLTTAVVFSPVVIVFNSTKNTLLRTTNYINNSFAVFESYATILVDKYLINKDLIQLGNFIVHRGDNAKGSGIHIPRDTEHVSKPEPCGLEGKYWMEEVRRKACKNSRERGSLLSLDFRIVLVNSSWIQILSILGLERVIRTFGLRLASLIRLSLMEDNMISSSNVGDDPIIEHFIAIPCETTRSSNTSVNSYWGLLIVTTKIFVCEDSLLV